MSILVFRLLLALLALALLVNGGYEYFFLEQTSDAALNVALCALMLSWYMDIAKQDRKI